MDPSVDLVSTSPDIFSRVKARVASWVHALEGVRCNICGWRGQQFHDWHGTHGHVYRNAECPDCGSHPRHRSFHLYLQSILPKANRVRLLHCSPEEQLRSLLLAHENVDYLSIDIDPARAMRAEDIAHLSFDDESFDVIICIHVLEHVLDDRSAINELFRVLAKDGFALIDVPIDRKRAETYEDASITTPEARSAAFGQADHVRQYGRDFADRLASAGFKVTQDTYIQSLGGRRIRRHKLQSAPINFCTK